ncbi:hypothetical protein QCA50_014201 [Cerrena zonata]|uniref:Uncharacterized protein n=1 Tax=Cerrena zonata TaxID=2478898 RepID=A0AAW0FU44_9APHY
MVSREMARQGRIQCSNLAGGFWAGGCWDQWDAKTAVLVVEPVTGEPPVLASAGAIAVCPRIRNQKAIVALVQVLHSNFSCRRLPTYHCFLPISLRYTTSTSRFTPHCKPSPPWPSYCPTRNTSSLSLPSSTNSTPRRSFF